jgi:hypothetical protein
MFIVVPNEPDVVTVPGPRSAATFAIVDPGGYVSVSAVVLVLLETQLSTFAAVIFAGLNQAPLVCVVPFVLYVEYGD